MRDFLRPALLGFAVTAAVLLGLGGLQHLNAQALGAHNSNAPVQFDADRIELQDRENRVILSGNVDIRQADLRLRANRTTMNYLDTGSLQIQRIDASGGVTVTRGNESARGSVAVYDFNRRLIVMSGDVSLQRGSDRLSGGRLVIDLNTGRSSVDGRGSGSSTVSGESGGRVSGTFTVPDQD